MKTNVSDFRYRIGDMLGDYAPDSFRRQRSTSGWKIGLGGIFAAMGLSYLATKIANGRINNAIDKVVPDSSEPVHGDGTAIHGFEGGRTQDSELSGTSGR